MLAPLLRHSRLWQLAQFRRGRTQPVRGPLQLSQRRIYILPTRSGAGFGLALLLMLIGSINYQLALGYLMTFLLASTALVAMLHTWRNLAHLRIETGKAEPTFAGGAVRFHLHLHNPTRRERIAIDVECTAARVQCDVPAHGDTSVTLALDAARRGRLALPPLVVCTRYPLGLFRAWAPLHLDAYALVYPRPIETALPPPQTDAMTGTRALAAPGNEDFQGLRAYRPGDSLRRIAWKSAAHGDTLPVKLFSGEGRARLWLDYAQQPPARGVEARLSHLTGAVLQATEAGLTFGLRLPQHTIDPASGQAHRDACLRALALHGLRR